MPPTVNNFAEIQVKIFLTIIIIIIIIIEKFLAVNENDNNGVAQKTICHNLNYATNLISNLNALNNNNNTFSKKKFW